MQKTYDIGQVMIPIRNETIISNAMFKIEQDKLCMLKDRDCQTGPQLICNDRSVFDKLIRPSHIHDAYRYVHGACPVDAIRTRVVVQPMRDLSDNFPGVALIFGESVGFT